MSEFERHTERLGALAGSLQRSPALKGTRSRTLAEARTHSCTLTEAPTRSRTLAKARAPSCTLGKARARSRLLMTDHAWPRLLKTTEQPTSRCITMGVHPEEPPFFFPRLIPPSLYENTLVHRILSLRKRPGCPQCAARAKHRTKCPNTHGLGLNIGPRALHVFKGITPNTGLAKHGTIQIFCGC